MTTTRHFAGFLVLSNRNDLSNEAGGGQALTDLFPGGGCIQKLGLTNDDALHYIPNPLSSNQLVSARDGMR